MAEPRGVLAETEMPDFSIMGLLLGGSGYASGWFQSRDKLRIADALSAKQQAEAAAFRDGVLANPQTQEYIKNPYSNKNVFGIWGQFAGGPQEFRQTGNQLLTQGLGGIAQRDLAAAQHQYQLGEQSQAHGFRLEEQTHNVDEQLRYDQRRAEAEYEQKAKGLDYLASPQGGMTPFQQRLADQLAAQQAGVQVQPGHDLMRNATGEPIGWVPSPGTAERAKIEMTGNAISNVSSMAGQMQWQLQNDPGNIDVDQWNEQIRFATNDMRRIYEAGDMSKEAGEFFMTVLPQLGKLDRANPDSWGTVRDKLRVAKEWADRELNHYVASTLVPLETYTGDDFTAPEIPPPPPQSAIRDRNVERLKDLGAPSDRTYRRGGRPTTTDEPFNPDAGQTRGSPRRLPPQPAKQR